MCGVNSHPKITRYLWGKRHPYDLRFKFILARSFTPIQKQPTRIFLEKHYFHLFLVNSLLSSYSCWWAAVFCILRSTAKLHMFLNQKKEVHKMGMILLFGKNFLYNQFTKKYSNPVCFSYSENTFSLVHIMTRLKK